MPKGVEQWIVQVVTPILCATALLLGVVTLGRAARAALHDRAGYTVAFHDIDCEPPQGMSRREFLGEVRQFSRQRETLHLLDEDVTARLTQAFAVHPWVESVRCVQIVRWDRRPAGLRVELSYRQPVLAVCHAGDKVPRDSNTLRSTRAVDRHGVLLPVSAVHSRLPVLSVDSTAPSGAAGGRCGDRRVSAAAATVAFLKPHLARLHLEDCDIEIVGEEIVFCKPGVRIVWGHAPGHEEAGEAPAKVKLRRLLDYQAGHDGLESLEHDVRLLAFQGHFPLALNTRP
jgi:hypothetical protein